MEKISREEILGAISEGVKQAILEIEWEKSVKLFYKNNFR